MGRILTAKRSVLSIAVAVLVAAGLFPILIMVIRSFVVDGKPSFANYESLFASGHEWKLVVNTLALAAATTLLDIALGVPLAILLVKTDLGMRRVFTILLCVPLLVPPYILALSWSRLLGISGFSGCVLVLSTVFLPIPVLLTTVALKGIDPRLEEAARLASRWGGVLRVITLPLSMPAVALAALLVFLLSMGELTVPLFLRYDVFPAVSFAQFSAFYNFGAATAAAVPLALVTFLLIAFEQRLLRNKSFHLRPTGYPLTIRLGKGRVALAIGVALFLSAMVVLPLGGLVMRSGDYSEALARGGGSLLRSIAYAAIGATALALLGFLIGYSIHTRALRLWRAVDSLTLFLFALPGTVVATGLISLWNRPATNFVYATPAIILLGYIAQYTALTSRMTLSALAQIPPSMEEAAQIAGAGWLRRMRLIVTPLAGRGIVASWLVAYIFCMRETGVTMMVYPAGQDTLPVHIYTLMANGPQGVVAALCVLLIIATLVPPALLVMAAS